MRIAREAEITLLQSPHTAELSKDGKHLIYAAAGLFACDFSGRTTHTFRKPSGYGARDLHVTRSGRLVAQRLAPTNKSVVLGVAISGDGRIVVPTPQPHHPTDALSPQLPAQAS